MISASFAFLTQKTLRSKSYRSPWTKTCEWTRGFIDSLHPLLARVLRARASHIAHSQLHTRGSHTAVCACARERNAYKRVIVGDCVSSAKCARMTQGWLHWLTTSQYWDWGGDKKTKIRETPTGSARRGERCEGGGEGGEDCNATPAESDGYNVITTTGNLPVPRAPEIVDEVGAGWGALPHSHTPLYPTRSYNQLRSYTHALTHTLKHKRVCALLCQCTCQCTLHSGICTSLLDREPGRLQRTRSCLRGSLTSTSLFDQIPDVTWMAGER